MAYVYEAMEKQKLRKKKRNKAKQAALGQNGYEQTGQATLMSMQQAVERRASLKNELELKFRGMVNKYATTNAHAMIKQHQALIDKENGVPVIKEPQGGQKSWNQMQIDKMI